MLTACTTSFITTPSSYVGRCNARIERTGNTSKELLVNNLKELLSDILTNFSSTLGQAQNAQCNTADSPDCSDSDFADTLQFSVRGRHLYQVPEVLQWPRS